jgi:hypothetical protein
MKKNVLPKPNRKASATDLAVAERAYEETLLAEFTTFFDNCIDEGENVAAGRCAKGLAMIRSGRDKLVTLL